MRDPKKEEKFLKVLSEYQFMIRKVAHSYVNDEEERKDLIQEIILQIWKSFDRYSTEYKYSTWIYRIALNVSISYLRKLKKDRKRRWPWMFHKNLNHNTENELKQEKIDQLYNAINHLDELNRALMILYLEEKSYEEIADILGISVSNVGTKLNRIKKKLKNRMISNQML